MLIEDKIEEAEEKGKQAYYDGLALIDNPMTERDTRFAWQESFVATKKTDIISRKYSK